MCIFIYITLICISIHTSTGTCEDTTSAGRRFQPGATRSCRAQPWRAGEGAAGWGFLLQDGPRIEVTTL